MMILQKLEKFLNTKWYVIGIMALTFVLWISQNKSASSVAITVEPMFFVSLLIMTILFAVVAVFFENTYYCVPILLATMCIIGVNHGRAFNVDMLSEGWFIYILIGIVLAALLYHLIRFKVKLKFGALTIGLVLIAIGYILPFRINSETESLLMINIVYSLAGPLYLLLYMFFISTTKEKNIEKYLFVFFILSILISAQFLAAYIRALKGIIDGGLASNILEALKQGITLKWNTSLPVNFELGYDNINAGVMYLSFFLPTAIYYACKKKINWPYLLYFITVLALVIISASRGGYIGMAITVILSVIVLCKYSNKTAKIFMGVSAAVFLLVLFVPFIEGESLFNTILERILNGGDDLEDFSNGRFELYREALRMFKRSPFIGGGHIHFNEITAMNRPIFYHSTFFHAIGTMGLVGLLSLIFHLVQVVKLVKKKWCLEVLIFGIGMLATHIHGLIDNTFYAFYYMIMTLIVYNAIESLDLSLATAIKKKEIYTQ